MIDKDTLVVSVKFRDNYGEYSKEYTYLSIIPVKPLDFVLVPGNPTLGEWYTVARVKQMLTHAHLKDNVKYKSIISVLDVTPPKPAVPMVTKMQGLKMVPPPSVKLSPPSTPKPTVPKFTPPTPQPDFPDVPL